MVSNNHSSFSLSLIVPSLLISWAASGISPSVLLHMHCHVELPVGTLSRYQAVSIEAVLVACNPKLGVHKSELWGGRWQECGIPNPRYALGSKQCIWSPGLDIIVGSGLYLQTFMRYGVTFKTAQQWLLISRNVLYQASLVIHFVVLMLVGKVSFYF